MKKGIKGMGFYISLFTILVLLVYIFSGFQKGNEKIVYSDLYNQVTSGNVKELAVLDDIAYATLNKPMKIYDEDGKVAAEVEEIEVEIPNMLVFEMDLGPTIRQQMADGKLEYDTQKPKDASIWASILPMIIMGVIILLFYLFVMNQTSGGGKAMSFGKSKAKMISDDKKKVTFAQVAGADEEKAELEEIVDFLKKPQRFMELGARIPKGVLLVGPPGTGKTLLAKAVAGEAGVPFFSISGSDFVEMFVGVGASRVRDLFEQAKKNSPSIVFIDEIDAVGRHRGAGLGGGHDEREQTLNQLLVEMDGFGENSGVIVIAATNRPDILDPALLRPGRFDRQVVVGVPDVKGREEILKIHSAKKPLDANVDLSVIAKATAGFTGADLENLMNEAALLAARSERKSISLQDLQDSMMKVVMGTEKKSRKVSERERKLTAFHEAGHAVVSRFLETQDPVHEVSIIPRGMAGGYTMYIPAEDKWYASKTEMLEDIMGLLGGRVAEKITLDDISTGASNDIERATSIARKMVTKYGMSDELGPINYSSGQEVFIGKDFGHARDFSEKIAAQIDDEVRKIIDSCYKKCEEILREHINELTQVANILLDKEKISGKEFAAIFGDTYEDEFEKLKNASASEQVDSAEEAVVTDETESDVNTDEDNMEISREE